MLIEIYVSVIFFLIRVLDIVKRIKIETWQKTLISVLNFRPNMNFNLKGTLINCFRQKNNRLQYFWSIIFSTIFVQIKHHKTGVLSAFGMMRIFGLGCLLNLASNSHGKRISKFSAKIYSVWFTFGN